MNQTQRDNEVSRLIKNVTHLDAAIQALDMIEADNEVEQAYHQKKVDALIDELVETEQRIEDLS